MLRHLGLSFPTPTGPMSLHELWWSTVLFARVLLHPSTANPNEWNPLRLRDDVDARREIVDEGRRLFVAYKAMLAWIVPWKADRSHGWFQRLEKEQPTQAGIMARVNFIWNSTACAQGAHEFFIAGALNIEDFGRRADKIHEEALEHFLLYVWLVAHSMGSLRHAATSARLRYSLILMWAGVWAGCPKLYRRARLMVHKAYVADKIRAKE